MQIGWNGRLLNTTSQKYNTKQRKGSKLGIKDKQWIDYLSDCDNPAAELFLFMHYGGKGEWCNHWMKLNKNVTARNDEMKSTKTRKILFFTMKEFLVGHTLFIGAVDCSQRGLQLWQPSYNNNNTSWTSMSTPTNFSQWMSSFKFKHFKQFMHTTWQSKILKGANNPWWKIEEAITTFNNVQKEQIQTSHLRTVDETMSVCKPQTRKTGDPPIFHMCLANLNHLVQSLNPVPVPY
jgi:hypothetical protein